MTGSERDLQQALERFLSAVCRGPVRVENLRSLPGGASARLYGFDLVARSEPRRRPMVLRMDPEPGRMVGSRAAEFALLTVAGEAGVRVPAVHWCGDAGDGLGAAFFVMDHVAGEALGRRLLRDDCYRTAREAMPGDLARELARIHAIDVSDPRLSMLDGAGGSAADRAAAEVDRYRALLEEAVCGHPMPVLELTARWLEQAVPPAGEAALVHGDFRIGNVLFDEQGLTAVLDWELAHVGDPTEDLGWLCVRAWRFGVDDQPVGGLCGREELWRLYEEASGRRVDPDRAAYWEIFGNWKWAIICAMQASGHRAGRYPNVELAAIGRRIAEVEWEILRLLEKRWHGAR